MDEYERLSHSKLECKHHVVFIPKCRRKMLYGNLRKHLGDVFRKLAEQKECRIEEGHLLADPVHLMISIPPKYAVPQGVGFIKGKSAIHLARVYGERKQNYAGQSTRAEETLVPQRPKMEDRMLGSAQRDPTTTRTPSKPIQGGGWDEALGRIRRDRFSSV